jgi:YD repeat-containing protein
VADGQSISYIWGHGAQYPIAEASNASHGTVFHTSFEETGTQGADAKTGRRYMLGPYTFSPPAGFTPASGSTLSYWSWSNATSKWSLVEQPYSGGTVTCSGDRVDEVRITPPGSQMTTYTYDPLVGVTSVTDGNGKTAYYEYTGPGRLKLVRDQDRNIVQEHQYIYRK